MKYAIALILLFTASISIAQNCQNTLSGYIIDLHDQSPLANANVILAGAETLHTTDSNGRYTISGLCDATYTLQVSHEFCETQLVRVVVRGNTERSINMEHHLEALGEVTLSGKTTTTDSKTGQEQLITSETLQANAAASLGDALKSVSGVSSLNTGNTVVKPVIQGLHSSRVILVTDGTRLQDQEWGVEHAPNLDLNAAGSIAVVKGASALQYGGDAVGGTIIVKPARIPQADSLYGHTIATAATNGRGGSITSTLTKAFNAGWYVSAQGTYKRFGDFNAPDYVLSNTGAKEQDISFRVGRNTYAYGYELSYSLYDTELGILRASHVGSSGDLALAIESDRPLVVNEFTYDINAPKQATKHQVLRAQAFKRFDNIGKLNFQYDFQKNNRLEFDIRRDSDDTRPSIDLELRTHSATLDFEYTADNTLSLKTGVLGRFQKNFPDPITGVRRLIPDYERLDFGIYATGAKVYDRWTVEGGVRYDYNHIDAQKFYRTSFWESRGYDVLFGDLVLDTFESQVLVNPTFTFNNISATSGTAYDFNALYSIAANVSLATRAPNPSELFSDGLHQSAARIELGDIRFDQERSTKVGVTLSRKHKNFSFNIAPFINRIDNFLLIEPTGSQQTLRGNFQVWEYRQTAARLLGIDVDASFRLTDKLSMTNQLSVVNGRDTTRDEALINMPPVNTRNRITYYKPEWHQFKFWVESFYSFEQTAFPDTNLEVFVPAQNQNVLVDVSTPPEAYHVLNMRGSLDFNINTNTKLEVALAVNNALDTSYRDYLNRLRYYADDLGRNFLLQLKINY